MERNPISREGYEKIRAEIRHLEEEEMPLIAEKIAEARAEGDLSENAEYHGQRHLLFFEVSNFCTICTGWSFSIIAMILRSAAGDRFTSATAIILTWITGGCRVCKSVTSTALCIRWPTSSKGLPKGKRPAPHSATPWRPRKSAMPCWAARRATNGSKLGSINKHVSFIIYEARLF